MEIKVIEEKKDSLQFEVYGADHVLMNLLRDELEGDKTVDFTTYSTPHPLLDGYLVTVKGKDPQASVKRALGAVKSEVKDIKDSFKKAK